MSGLTRDGKTKPVSRDQTLRRELGRRQNIFPCSANHDVDAQSTMCDAHKYIPRFVVVTFTAIFPLGYPGVDVTFR